MAAQPPFNTHFPFPSPEACPPSWNTPLQTGAFRRVWQRSSFSFGDLWGVSVVQPLLQLNPFEEHHAIECRQIAARRRPRALPRPA
jgi:hypothetical protein